MTSVDLNPATTAYKTRLWLAAISIRRENGFLVIFVAFVLFVVLIFSRSLKPDTTHDKKAGSGFAPERLEAARVRPIKARLSSELCEAVPFEVCDGEIAKQWTGPACVNPAEVIRQLAGRIGGGGDGIGLREIRAELRDGKLRDHPGTEIRAMDVDDFHRFLPALQAVDIA